MRDSIKGEKWVFLLWHKRAMLFRCELKFSKLIKTTPKTVTFRPPVGVGKAHRTRVRTVII